MRSTKVMQAIKAAASCPIDAAGRAGLRPYLFYRPNYRFFFFFFA
jgi:hypothetical protein